MPLFFDRAPEVTEVSVYEKSGDKWNYQAPIWQIESMDGVALRRVEYGVVPSGFVTKAPSAELIPGHEYKIGVRAWGASGELVFVLDKGTI
jgi:NH3-dependent NAD+ synthetase